MILLTAMCLCTDYTLLAAFQSIWQFSSLCVCVFLFRQSLLGDACQVAPTDNSAGNNWSSNVLYSFISSPHHSGNPRCARQMNRVCGAQACERCKKHTHIGRVSWNVGWAYIFVLSHLSGPCYSDVPTCTLSAVNRIFRNDRVVCPVCYIRLRGRKGRPACAPCATGQFRGQIVMFVATVCS
jgi:hypothetical protein